MNSKNFVVEVIEIDGIRTFIIREMNGKPIEITNEPSDVTSFFTDLKITA